jgi:RNA ligase (TIGR02306 family)
MIDFERKMAVVRKVEYLRPIPNADRIETAVVGGWEVVVQKGKFQAGNLAIYLEIDSWVPHELAPFLTKPGHIPKEYNGVPGQRLRTIKLKGQISQGLLLSPGDVPEVLYVEEGSDMTEYLKIQRWERPLPASLAGFARGNFPAFIPKTCQNRVQNCFDEYQTVGGLFEVTEKLDGSSMTVYAYSDPSDDTSVAMTGVCSRNLDLLFSEDNTFWQVVIRDNILNKLVALRRNLALQGELIGPGIQGNGYQLTRHEFHVFSIYDIDLAVYLSPTERVQHCAQLGLNHVPIVGCLSMCMYDHEGEWFGAWKDVKELLKYADGESLLCRGVQREGLVFKHTEKYGANFKVISNKWLLKETE